MSDGVKSEDYRKLLTEIIQKQIIILGPEISMLKAKNVEGMTVGEGGIVTEITGDPQVVLQNLINEYVALSGLIVKKTMEPLLQKYPSLAPQSQTGEIKEEK